MFPSRPNGLVKANEPRIEWIVFEASRQRIEGHGGVCENSTKDAAPSLMNGLAWISRQDK